MNNTKANKAAPTTAIPALVRPEPVIFSRSTASALSEELPAELSEELPALPSLPLDALLSEALLSEALSEALSVGLLLSSSC